MREVVEYHFALDEVVLLSLGEHDLNELDVHVVRSLLRDGVADKDVKGFVGVEEVFLHHVYDSDLQVVVQGNVDAHHVVDALVEFVLLFFVVLSEQVLEQALVHVLVQETEHVAGKSLKLLRVLLYQLLVAD